MTVDTASAVTSQLSIQLRGAALAWRMGGARPAPLLENHGLIVYVGLIAETEYLRLIAEHTLDLLFGRP